MNRRNFIIGSTIGGSIALHNACGKGSPTQPDPPPPTIPTPEPPPAFPRLSFPIRRTGSSFSQRLWGGIPLDKARGWPLINSRGLDELSESGINWTHIRLGPHGNNGPDADTTPTGDFWSKVEGALNYALIHGIAVEVDVIDGWVLKHDYNYFGWDRSIVRYAPTEQQKAWVREVVAHTQGFPNVMYQISNESNLIGATSAWELGIANILRSTGKLIGTNSTNSTVENTLDYVNRHQDGALGGPIAGRPSAINESGPDLLPEDWEREARRAIKANTIFHLWRGDMTDPQWAEALARNAKLRRETGL